MKLKRAVPAAYSVMRANISKKYRKPLSIYLFTTYRCPFSCRFCNIRRSGAPAVDMSTRQIMTAIDQMAAAGTVRLQFTGGEPLLREDIGELVRKSASSGLFTGISTSGYNLPEKAEEIKAADIIFLSFDGPEDIHDNIRGKNSFRILENAMESCRKNGIRFWTTTVLNRKNIGHIDYILDRALEEGFTANFAMLHSREDLYTDCFEDECEAERFLLSEEELKRVAGRIIEMKKKGYPVGTSFGYLDLLEQWEDTSVQYGMSGRRACWAGRLFGHIDPDGMLYPCGTLREKFKGENILELGFKKAFGSLEIPCSCNVCLSACQMEQNLIFSLKSRSVINWLRALLSYGKGAE